MGGIDTSTVLQAPFGSIIADKMIVSESLAGSFESWDVRPVSPLGLHPASHALHYGSACFEGLKAHCGEDGKVRLFRAADHAARLRGSAEVLWLPVPDAAVIVDMMRAAVKANLAQVPPLPGALYLRPTLLGVDTNIGAASTPSVDALLYILSSPVGDYFDSSRALTIQIETDIPRSTPQFGRVKSGANYAMALGVTMRARATGADQVLFAPGGDVQETGASNFMLLDDTRVVTKALDGSFLAGVTRNSVLTIARDFGYQVEERDVTVDEVFSWAHEGEAALMGTAAVLSGVGTVVHGEKVVRFGGGKVGPNTLRLRDALLEVARGQRPDDWGWTTLIDP